MEKDLFSFANLKEALVALIQKYHPFNIRYFKALVGVMMTLLMGTVLILGWLSSVKVKETVTEDFNQQQLVIARHAASQIENRLEALKRELFLLSLSPSIQYTESAWMCNRMEIAFSSIREEGTIEIRFVQDGVQRTFHVLGEHACNPLIPNKKELDHLEWAKKETNKGHILLTSVSSIPQEDRSLRPIMEIAIPVWQGSVDQSHPVALNKFSGVLLFTIDLSILMGNVTREIRSGKTGYSWIIDENGTFLYHK